VPGTGPGQQPRRYEIRVRGRLGETFQAAFPSLRGRTQGHETVLSGPLADRAALYGVLAEIETLGLDLVELRQLGPGASAPDRAALSGVHRPGLPGDGRVLPVVRGSDRAQQASHRAGRAARLDRRPGRQHRLHHTRIGACLAGKAGAG
jgi:hypothetical protein